MAKSTLRKPMRRTVKTVVGVPCPPVNAIVEFEKVVVPKKRRSVAKLELAEGSGIFSIYIKRLLSYMDESSSITAEDRAFQCSANGLNILNGMCTDLCARLCAEASKLAVHNGMKTITPALAIAAINVVLQGQLAAGAINAGKISDVSFDRINKLINASEMSASRTAKAQLIFPVPRVETILKEHTKKRVSASSAIYIAAATQYICSEVLDNTFKIVKAVDMKTIRPNHLKTAITNDMELSCLFKNTTVISG